MSKYISYSNALLPDILLRWITISGPLESNFSHHHKKVPFKKLIKYIGLWLHLQKLQNKEDKPVNKPQKVMTSCTIWNLQK